VLWSSTRLQRLASTFPHFLRSPSFSQLEEETREQLRVEKERAARQIEEELAAIRKADSARLEVCPLLPACLPSAVLSARRALLCAHVTNAYGTRLTLFKDRVAALLSLSTFAPVVPCPDGSSGCSLKRTPEAKLGS